MSRTGAMAESFDPKQAGFAAKVFACEILENLAPGMISGFLI